VTVPVPTVKLKPSTAAAEPNRLARPRASMAVAVFGASAQALMSLVAAKPELGQALEHTTGRAGGLGDIERHFAAYLGAEKKLGRITRTVLDIRAPLQKRTRIRRRAA
jgi:hypothetical protein